MFWWGLLVGIIIMSAPSAYALIELDNQKEGWACFFFKNSSELEQEAVEFVLGKTWMSFERR